MKLSGWIFMLTAWTMIISLMIFCFSRIFKQGAENRYKQKKDLKNEGV